MFKKLTLPLMLSFLILFGSIPKSEGAEVSWDIRRDRALAFTFSNPDKYRYDIVYRLVVPENYDKNKKYPLILEYTPERGDDNFRQLDTNSVAKVLTGEEYASKYPCFILLPMCPKGTHYHTGLKHPMNDVMEATLDILDEVIQNFSVDTNRIYAGGVSAGASGVWELIARRPDLFAAAFPIAGAPADTSMAPLLKDVPIWAFTAADDGGAVLFNTRIVISEMRKLGKTPKYTEYPYGQHAIWYTKVYKDPAFFQWLFRQKKDAGDAFHELNFDDIDYKADYYDSLAYLVEKKVIQEQGSFLPEENLLLSDAIRWLVRAYSVQEGLQPDAKSSPNQYLEETLKLNIINYLDFPQINNYRQSISREQCARMLSFMFDTPQYDFQKYTSLIHDFDDVQARYQEYVLQAYLFGIMDITEQEEFEPKKYITRSEFCTILHRILEPGMRQVVDESILKSDKANSLEIIGETDIDLVGEREAVRKGETNLGRLIADAMKIETNSDIAIMQGGGIRSTIPRGKITYKHIYTVLPFDNTVVVLEVSGSDIIKALEVGLASYPESNNSFLHVAGMRVEASKRLPAGSRVREVTIGGEPIINNKKYKVATNNYIAEGGDNFSMLAQAPVLSQHNTIAQVLCDYIGFKGVEYEKISEERVLIK